MRITTLPAACFAVLMLAMPAQAQEPAANPTYSGPEFTLRLPNDTKLKAAYVTVKGRAPWSPSHACVFIRRPNSSTLQYCGKLPERPNLNGLIALEHLKITTRDKDDTKSHWTALRFSFGSSYGAESATCYMDEQLTTLNCGTNTD
ncbi:MAG: hypothetical protein WAX89_08400 [Alphaproteobacteria bacterium]